MNLFDIPTGPLSGEITDILRQDNAVRIERIVSDGQTTGWYDQREGEFVALLAGSACLEFAEGQKVELRAGDNLFIEPHKKHRVSFTSREEKCIWLCVFIKAR